MAVRQIDCRYKRCDTSYNYYEMIPPPLLPNLCAHLPCYPDRYEPGFWEGLKYAWIQYLALLVVAYHVITRVRGFVFLNMILTTLKQDKLKEN